MYLARLTIPRLSSKVKVKGQSSRSYEENKSLGTAEMADCRWKADTN